MFDTCIYSELLLSCISCFTGVAGASLTSCFTGVAGISPLTLSTPVTDIKLFRSLEFDLWSTFVTRNLKRAKESSLVFPHRSVRSFSGPTAWAETNFQVPRTGCQSRHLHWPCFTSEHLPSYYLQLFLVLTTAESHFLKELCCEAESRLHNTSQNSNFQRQLQYMIRIKNNEEN